MLWECSRTSFLVKSIYKWFTTETYYKFSSKLSENVFFYFLVHLFSVGKLCFSYWKTSIVHCSALGTRSSLLKAQSFLLKPQSFLLKAQSSCGIVESWGAIAYRSACWTQFLVTEITTKTKKMVQEFCSTCALWLSYKISTWTIHFR